LKADTEKIEKHIENDKMTTSDKQKDADDATNARKNLENDIKAADARIQNIKSDIDKNLD
jgi:hypothetical protein